MRNLRRLCITALFAIAVVAAAQSAASAQNQPARQTVDAPVVISYSLLNDHLTLHEPVVLIFTAANKTNSPIQLDLGQDLKEGFLFAVTDPNGIRHPLRPYMHQGLYAPGIISIASGHTYSQKLVLNQWYAFSAPGRYVLEAHLGCPIGIGPCQGVGQQTDQVSRIMIDIGPRDEAALTKTCESLVKEIVGPNAQDAADAALALSYVDDPLAEPYLRRALFEQSDPDVEDILLKGLGRVGDARSVGVLAEAAKTADDGEHNVKGNARLALYHIRQRTSDPQVRDEINRILANP